MERKATAQDTNTRRLGKSILPFLPVKIKEEIIVSVIDAMNAYIERTHLGNTARYEIVDSELQELNKLLTINRFNALMLAFNYGLAKGYRKAKKGATPWLS